MRAFAQHLVERYGIDEVSQWYFEVWNEPNIDFWAGDPKQATYFDLYDHTARALKAVNSRIRVGGPATAAAHWVPEFLNHAAEQHVPVDFVSTHGYADDSGRRFVWDARRHSDARPRLPGNRESAMARFKASAFALAAAVLDGMECPLVRQVERAR